MNSLPSIGTALAFASLFIGCAHAPLPSYPAPEAARGHIDAIDWGKAQAEATDVLSGYLRVDTVNPPGNEARGAAYLAEVLRRDGIESERFEVEPGRDVLLARVRGSGKEKPLCLLSHIDVVSAEAESWPADRGPLSGVVDGEGFIWGRGALDMKGMGTVETLTLAWLARQKVPLRRDVILVAVPDEEVSNKGMQYVVDKLWDRIGCSHLVNEGGIGLQDLFFPGQTAYAISVAEKGVLWMRMKATGEAGHGSTPVPTRAPTRLARAISLLLERDPEVRVDPSVYALLAQVGEQHGGLTGFVMKRPFLVDRLVVGKLLENPSTRAVVTDTCQFTGYEGAGSSPNVVPSRTSAVMDCRVLPGTNPDALLAELKERVKEVEGIEFEVIEKSGANGSDWNDPFFAALVRHAIDGRPNVVAGPVLSPGYTDSLQARPLGVRAYGFVPFEVPQSELAGMHGKNERVHRDVLGRGLKALYSAVVDVSVEVAP